jgi:basic membrane protein A
MAVPAVQRFGYGYLQGIDAAAKELGIVGDIKVEYVYGNQFYGDADITAVMDTWYGEKGVELVFACGGGIWTSAAEAAAKVGGKVIGVDVDQAAIIDGAYGEGMTVTSAMKGLAPTVNTLLTAIVLEDNWAAYAGKIETLGLVSADPEANYVQIPMASTQFAEGFTAEDYSALVAAMFEGTVAVSGDISAFPTTEVAVEQHANIKG